jgi:ABC-2 type transport system permease protein
MAAAAFAGDGPLFLIDYLLRFLRVALLLAIWRTLLAGRGAVSGMTLPAVLTYTLIAEVFAEQLACRSEIADSFWDGTIATRFLKPIGITGQFTSEMLGRWLFGFGVCSLPLLLCAPLLGVDPLPADLSAGCCFLLSLILAISVGLALEFIFAAIAIGAEMPPFATERIRRAIGAILSGAFIPLALLPWGLGSIFSWLPFASMASAPLQIYIGTGRTWWLIGLQAGWSLLLWPAAAWMWRVNRERMVSYGG